MYDIALDSPRKLRTIAPTGVFSGKEYYIVVCTQSSARGGGALPKTVREVKSDVAALVQ